ncbi:MAG: hypothetical protein AAGD96_29655, partial [Chloroflexota bacterium]
MTARRSSNYVSEADISRFARLKWLTLGLLFLLPSLLWLMDNASQPTEQPDPNLSEITLSLSKITEALVSLQGQDQTQLIEVDVNISGLPLTYTIDVPQSTVFTQTVEVEVTRIVTQLVEIEPSVTPFTVTVQSTQTTVIYQTIEKGPPPPAFTPTPGRACTRFNFDIGRNHETGSIEAGLYVMQESNGRIVTTWQAQKGWKDSGWQQGFNISADAVHVIVLFYPDSGGWPIEMEILN